MATINSTQWTEQELFLTDESSDQEIISASRQVDERFLAALVRRIVEVSGATRVILFGSRARNEERDDSDVDLFVIVPGSTEERDAKRRAISRALVDRWIPHLMSLAIATSGQSTRPAKCRAAF